MKDRGSFGGWVGNLLIPYSKNVNIFTCPSNPQLNNVNYGNNCAGSSGTDAASALAKWGIPYVWTSYGYNYQSLDGQGQSNVSRPAELIAIYDAISSPSFPSSSTRRAGPTCSQTSSRSSCQRSGS